MGTPIIGEILDIIRTAISTATSTIGHFISVAPKPLKIMLFLFLSVFITGFALNFSLGLYYACYDGDLYKPDNAYDAVVIKYLQFTTDDEVDLEYCSGQMETWYCPLYETELECQCVCGEIWNQTGDGTCDSGLLGIFTDWTFDASCGHYSENKSCCNAIAGCYWVESYSDTPFYQNLIEKTIIVKPSENSFHLGCSGDEGDNISLFFGNLDLLAWETALAITLLTVAISLFIYIRNA